MFHGCLEAVFRPSTKSGSLSDPSVGTGPESEYVSVNRSEGGKETSGSKMSVGFTLHVSVPVMSHSRHSLPGLAPGQFSVLQRISIKTGAAD